MANTTSYCHQDIETIMVCVFSCTADRFDSCAFCQYYNYVYIYKPSNLTGKIFFPGAYYVSILDIKFDVNYLTLKSFRTSFK